LFSLFYLTYPKDSEKLRSLMTKRAEIIKQNHENA
jgi:hypothetical protein